MIPYGSRYMAEAVVALRRIQEVLLVRDSRSFSNFILV